MAFLGIGFVVGLLILLVFYRIFNNILHISNEGDRQKNNIKDFRYLKYLIGWMAKRE